jgi:LuxR family maltose regulon positive regulatory protein
MRVAWLSLDEGDNDPSRFLTYVVAALQTLDANIGSEALSLLHDAPALPVDVALTALINDAATARGRIVLVLDDYHVIDAPPVHQAVGFLLDHLPPQLHLAIASRSDPPLPLARLRSRGELTELRAADLRFTREEAVDFLNRAMGLGLSTDDIVALETRTEGWIAGLQLAALSLRQQEDVAGFISTFTGSHRFLIDYLVEEVLQHQPDRVREFLLRTAFLDRLTGPLCDTVTGLDGGSAMLATLERDNLFVVPLDDQRQWYRYHHLFAEVLRSRVLQEHPDHVPAVHSAASEWYERNGFAEDAVRHALAAQDFERAARLIESALPEARRSRHDATLLGWLTTLPDDLVRRRPALSVVRAWLLLVSGDLEAVEPWLDEAERWLGAALTREEFFTLAAPALALKSSRVDVRRRPPRAGWGRRASPRPPRGGCGPCPVRGVPGRRSPRPERRLRRVPVRRPRGVSTGCRRR